jgi:hypothetical protein
MKLSELMRVTVAEPQVRGREAQDERSGKQTCDHRNTNRQGGRVRAASVPLNTKPKDHQDASGIAGWRAGKVQGLTRGDLPRESAGEVSRGRSSEEALRKQGRAKGRSMSKRGLTESCRARRETSGTHGATVKAATVDRREAEEPVQPGGAATGEDESRSMSPGERKP